MSSCNHDFLGDDAVVIFQGHHVGPLRLPRENSQQFVDEFNGCYARIGLRVKEQKKSPALSSDNAGDGWSVDSVGLVLKPN